MAKKKPEDLELYLEHVLGLMVIDTEGRLVYMNDQCAEYIEVDRASSIGRPIREVFPPSTMEQMLDSENDTEADFYFAEGRISFTRRRKLKKGGKVIGIIEYDLLQDVDSLQQFIEKYTHILNAGTKKNAEQLKSLRKTNYSLADLVGSSAVMNELKQQIMRAALTSSTVLITGETGTGKEIVAHSIHNQSNRTFGRFIKVNAAALPEGLAEAEFFGYEAGAFTGAVREGKKGKFELADGGTLFIDEVSSMPFDLQPKLLRTLQEREVDRIGGTGSIPIDVRIIAATNQDLVDLVTRGLFRQDLYHRLNVFPIRVPPLRERLEDIPELVMGKVIELNIDFGKNVLAVDDAVYRQLSTYDWPGNVRELHNMVENAMNYVEGDTLRLSDFNFRFDNNRIDIGALSAEEKPIEAITREAERKLITEVLIRFDGNKTRAAAFLKIPRPLLYQKMRRLGVEDVRPAKERP
ncbi:MAG: sigma 54-interacting transcriptional regulator [Clostridiales Family XIII bacterium]|jgi:transcriptional regulator with PAS, ATPase and Fis domain|nr:sigma 54-interacting transcriptional regulator [Clostridiales Family XIII bacterium]